MLFIYCSFDLRVDEQKARLTFKQNVDIAIGFGIGIPYIKYSERIPINRMKHEHNAMVRMAIIFRNGQY